MAIETCKTCKWFYDRPVAYIRDCRKKAPDRSMNNMDRACWPQTSDTDFCGDHKPREEDGEDSAKAP